MEIFGTVRALRRGKKMSFLEVGYGTYQVQVVCKTASLPEDLTLQSYVKVVGTKSPLPQGVYSSQDYEITDATVSVVSRAEEKTIQACPPGSSLETRLEQRLYYFRDPTFVLVMRMQALLLEAFRGYFRDSEVLEIIPPSFTGVECEGGASLFKVKHPGKTSTEDMDAYLTQSSQFALEYVLPGVGDCYCIAPSFRAEHSHTRRHLTEFTHIEAEWGGITTFEKHLEKLSSMLRGTVSRFLILAEGELKAFGAYERVKKLEEMLTDIVILTHEDAIKKCRELLIYKDEEKKEMFGDRDDIPEAQERKLIDAIGNVVFLVKFPKEFKSFYMGLDPADPTRVLGCDVEVPGVGEIIGSGVREADHDRLYQRLVEFGLKPDDYREYLTLRKSGFCQTSGMGLGLGRMLCWLLDISSIRDTTIFPRFPGYLRP